MLTSLSHYLLALKAKGRYFLTICCLMERRIKKANKENRQWLIICVEDRYLLLVTACLPLLSLPLPPLSLLPPPTSHSHRPFPLEETEENQDDDVTEEEAELERPVEKDFLGYKPPVDRPFVEELPPEVKGAHQVASGVLQQKWKS